MRFLHRGLLEATGNVSGGDLMAARGSMFLGRKRVSHAADKARKGANQKLLGWAEETREVRQQEQKRYSQSLMGFLPALPVLPTHVSSAL